MSEDPYSLDLAAWNAERALERGDVPFDRVESTSLALARYNDTVATAGRPRFSALMERRTQDARRVHDYYTRPDMGLGPEKRQELDGLLRSSQTPDDDRAGMFNLQWFANNYQLPLDVAAKRHSLLRDHYAANEMGKTSATDSEIFGHIQKRYEFTDLLGKAVKDSTLAGEPSVESFAKFLKANEGHAGFNAAKKDEVRQLWERQRAGLEKDLAPYMPIINDTVRDLGAIQGTGKTKVRTAEDFESLAARLAEVPESDKDFVLHAIADIAEARGAGSSKTLPKQLGEKLARGAETLVAGINKTNMNEAVFTDPVWLDSTRVLKNAKDPVGDALSYNTANNLAMMRPVDPLLPFSQAGAQARYPEADTRPLTAEEKGEVKKRITAAQDHLDLATRLQEIAYDKADPVKGDYLATRGLYAAAESVPYTLMAMVPGVGIPATMQAMAADNYNKLRRDNPNLKREDAWAYSVVAAVPQAFAERLEGGVLFGKMPTFAALMNRAVAPRVGSVALRAGIRGVEGTAAEYVTENAQDLMPEFVHDLAKAIESDTGLNLDNTLRQASEQFKGENQAELVASLALLSFIGGGVGTWRDVRNSRELLSNSILLRPFLDSDAQAAEVRALALRGDMDAATALFNERAAPKLKAGMTLEKSAAQAIATMQERSARQRVARESLVSTNINAPEIARSERGWTLRFADNSTVDYGSHEEADAARWTHTYEVHGLRPVELMRQIFARSEQAQMKPGDTWQRAFDLLPLHTSDKEKMAREGLAGKEEELARREEQSKALMGGQTIEEDHATAAALVESITPHADDALAGQWILGTNVVQFQDGVRKITTKMFGGHEDVAPLTALEEDAETEAKTVLAQPGGQAWMLSALREYEAVTGDTVFRTADDSDLKRSDFVEAFSHMAVAVFAGKAVKGQSPAHPALAAGQFHNQLRGLFGLRINGVVSAMAQKWQAAFRRAAAIEKAQGEGKLKGDLMTAIARAAGLSEQDEHERAVVTEATELAEEASMATLSHGSHRSSVRKPPGARGAAKGHGSAAPAVREPGDLRRSLGGLAAQGRPLAAPEPLRGLTGRAANVEVPGRGVVAFGPYEPARATAAAYMAAAGLPYSPPTTYTRVDPVRATRIASEFEAMAHDPASPATRAAYEAMIRETLAQWQAIKATGLRVEPIPADMADPYALSPRLAILDVRENNHLWFLPTTSGFGSVEGLQSNPLLQPTGETINGHAMLANDVFRIVHDYFGHIKEGLGFRADGEENAWRSHSAMYSPEARRAMTTETRGQNSWVNFGPHAEHNRTATSDTIFAPQKIGLLPQWVVEDGGGDVTFSTLESVMSTRDFRQMVNNDAIALLHEQGRIKPPTIEITRDFRGRITGRRIKEQGAEWDFYLNLLDDTTLEGRARRKAFDALVFSHGGEQIGNVAGDMRESLGDDVELGSALLESFEQRERLASQLLAGEVAPPSEPHRPEGFEKGEDVTFATVPHGGEPIDDFEGSAPKVDWDATDMHGKWTKASVAKFVNVKPDRFIYRAMLPIGSLDAKRAEREEAKDFRSGKEEPTEFYMARAKELLDEWGDEKADGFIVHKPQFADLRDSLPWAWGEGYDDEDLLALAGELEARDVEGMYDEQEIREGARGGGYPPIVVTRTAEDAYRVEDGNHRADLWREVYDVAPAWVNDEWARAQSRVTFATSSAPIDAQLVKMFTPFQRSPDLRRRLGLEMQARAAEIGRQWENVSTVADWTRDNIDLLAESHADALKALRQKRDADLRAIATERDFLTPWGATERMSKEERAAIERDDKAKRDKVTRAYERERSEMEKSQALELQDVSNRMMRESDRERLIAAIRTLDAITVALPPEVRARVGGMAKIAELQSDKARLEWIANRVQKIDNLLERYLRAELTQQIEALFEASKPDREKGVKAKGKLGADTHEILEAAEAVARMDAMEVAGEIAKLDHALISGTLTPEQEATAERKRELFQLVGNMYPRSVATGKLDKNGKPVFHQVYAGATAARLDAALSALTLTRGEGFMEWTLAQMAKRAEREATRAQLQGDTGKTGARAERDAQRERASKLVGKARDRMLSLSSFSEVMRFIFGDSAQSRRLIDREREASNQKEDAMQALADEVDEFFAALAGSPLKGEQLRFDLAQISIRTSKASLSQMEAIQALLMWRQEDGQRHMTGQMDENNKPIGPWHYDQAWIDEVTRQMRPEAVAVMRFIQDHYANEYDEINEPYRQFHGVNLPRNNNYAPLTLQPVMASTGKLIDPVSGAEVSGSMLTPGSLRTRATNAVAEPRFLDALQTLLAHKTQINHWLAYYEFATDAQAILGNRELGNAAEAAGGKEARDVMQQWVDYFAQGGVRDSGLRLSMNQMLSRMSGRAATMALFGRISTLLIQSTQLAASAVKMPLGAYVVRMGKLMSGNLGWRDAISSDFIQRRIKQMPPIVRQAMDELATAKKPNAIKHAAQRLGKLLSGADGLFTAGTYAILLDYHRTQAATLGMSGATLEEWAHNEATRDTEEVAQPTRGATRSLEELTTTNPLGRLMWAFASESRQKLMLSAWAAYNGKGNKARLVKTIGLTFFVGGLMTQVIKNLWKMARGDDDEDMWSAKRLAIATLAGPLSGLPGFDALMGHGTVFSKAGQAGASVERLATMDEKDASHAWKDVKTVMWASGLFNDTAAGVTALANAGEEFAKLLAHFFAGE